MPKRTDLKKIMIIGSGPIVIGQAAEFDYAGTQACLSLKEEGYEVILVNSNPATIMTDTSVADKVYMEPLTLEYVARILRKERPDAIVPGIGGQTGLNLAMQLEQKGVLKECQVELLGTDSDSIRRAEDREQFKELCQSIGEPVIPSQITYNLEEAKAAAAAIGYPVVLRPAFTLGGTGGGFADDEAQLVELGMQAFKLSPIHQVLIEKSVKGYKEIEFEVMRDASDHAITICGMENIDPVGVHTGDSAVVAPIMTLSDHDMKMLNDSAIKIIRTLKIQGGCNVQFALNPKTSEYFLIEINPRVSRSSALASKASGYPIARVTAKVAVGMNLDEIAVANTTAAFEPLLDYVVAKLPRFPFDKFSTAANTLGTQMKATGEVMGIGSTLEECLLKSVRSLEIGAQHLWLPKFQNMTKAELTEYLRQFRDDGLFAVAQLLRLGASVDEVAALTMITPYFLETIRGIVDMEQTLCAHKGDGETLKQAKQMGFCDPYIARLWGVREEDVYAQRVQLGLYPAYKMVDTSHTGAYIPYFYSTYAPGAKSEARRSDKKKVVVLGAGPIRIGQGVEFDYSTVHAVQTIRRAGYEAIIINNNPETVSTDYTTSDKLYFEPLTVEDVMNVIHLEKPKSIVVSLGGQTAINLAEPLARLGGKPVIQRVYEQVAGVLDDAVVATDDERIRDAVRAFGGRVEMTSPDHRSGTDRCWEAYCKQGREYDVVVNVQGDEPFIRPSQLEAVKRCFDDPATDIATLVKPFTEADGLAALENPNSPKVVLDAQSRAIYFSRSVIPYLRGVPREEWLARHTFYKHIGLYAFRADVLRAVTALPQSPLELAESLEQLRWLENGYKIGVGISEVETIGIDTPEDLEKAERFLQLKIKNEE